MRKRTVSAPAPLIAQTGRVDVVCANRLAGAYRDRADVIPREQIVGGARAPLQERGLVACALSVSTSTASSKRIQDRSIPGIYFTLPNQLLPACADFQRLYKIPPDIQELLAIRLALELDLQFRVAEAI